MGQGDQTEILSFGPGELAGEAPLLLILVRATC